ncbi:hypothetical protein K7472_24320 [Streptomyces sp. PTM05]|uniref:DUF4232 domain-containing protein n=1 Tax=Streptantibioticus parmotrematis TaxID=2873249 RepID=A0ABS7QZ27_9ACTN|nr:hypothetical protein [Streptantibioticus parmotrematis]MBY8887941.1 hypothetical protein [Streptantibioticus parmotrematis]
MRPKRPRRVLALGAVAALPFLALAPVAVAGPVAAATVPGHAAAPPADGAPLCGDPAATGFPIASRLYGGPDAYTAGDDPSSFSLELRNTTDAACRDVHPLVLLVDRYRTLTPGGFRLEYARAGTWSAVPFETTDHAENIGIPGGENGPGYTLPAGATVTVPLRLRFLDDAPADQVVVSATAMQRRGADGAWVGESNHYTLDVLRPAPELAATGGRDRRVPPAALWTVGLLSVALVTIGAALVAASRRNPMRRW